jgi:hypothetical protein
MGVIMPAGPSLPVIALLLTTMLVTPIMGGSIDRRVAVQPIANSATMIAASTLRLAVPMGAEYNQLGAE